MKIKIFIFCVMVVGIVSGVTKKNINERQRINRSQDQNLLSEIELDRITGIINLIEHDQMPEQQRQLRLDTIFGHVNINHLITPQQQSQLLNRIKRLFEESQRREVQRIRLLDQSINTIIESNQPTENKKQLLIIKQQILNEGSWGIYEEERQQLLNKVDLLIKQEDEMVNAQQKIDDLLKAHENTLSNGELNFDQKLEAISLRKKEFKNLKKILINLSKINWNQKEKILSQVQKLEEKEKELKKELKKKQKKN